MGRSPAVVIIVRHGARLDAADKQWHLTSPTPYDPPLTYGGWTQSRALGVRIASLLDARELPSNQHHTEPRNDDPTDYGSTIASLDGQGSSVEHRHQTHKKRKHNVIIHSSPFLRCIQTSTAIAAGLGQFHGICNSTPEKSILSSQSHHTNQSIAIIISMHTVWVLE